MIPGIVAQASSGTTAFTPADFMADSPTALYSLRLLNPSYTGDCLRVRRSTDNTELDIGFSGGVLDTAALLAFCGAGNGFVRTWYDQSGNANHAVNATAANQPRIVASGVVDGVGGIPAIFLTEQSPGTYLTTPFHFMQSAQTAVYAFRRDSARQTTYTGVIGTQRSSRMGLGYSNGGYQNVQQLGTADKSFVNPRAGYAGTSLKWNVHGWATRGGQQSDAIIDLLGTFNGSDGVTMAMGGMGGSPSASYIGSNEPRGLIRELVVYPSFLSTQNRKSIEADMCFGVGVTPERPYFAPSDAYGVPGLKQVLGLRKLVPEYNGPAITVYNGTTTADIGFDGFGDLDMTALSALNVGSPDIIIQVWHNQLGDGNSPGNDSNGARIVVAGTLQTVDGTHPGIDFDTGRSLNSGWNPVLNPMTAIAAIYPRSTGAYHSLFSGVLSSAQIGFGWQPGGLMALMCNGVTHTVSNITVTVNTKQVVGFHCPSGYAGGVYPVVPFLNGPDGTAFTTNFSSRTAWNNHYRMGDTAATTDRFYGRIGEFIMADRELNSTDRYLVQNSMGSYYTITIT